MVWGFRLRQVQNYRMTGHPGPELTVVGPEEVLGSLGKHLGGPGECYGSFPK